MSHHLTQLLIVVGLIVLLIGLANYFTRNIKLACRKCGVELNKDEEMAHPGFCCNCGHVGHAGPTGTGAKV